VSAAIFDVSFDLLSQQIVLKNALVRRGIVFIEPSTVVLKGHSTEDHDVQRDYKFVCGLKRRLRCVPAPPPPLPLLRLLT
jgi:hypothetical protein